MRTARERQIQTYLGRPCAVGVEQLMGGKVRGFSVYQENQSGFSGFPLVSTNPSRWSVSEPVTLNGSPGKRVGLDRQSARGPYGNSVQNLDGGVEVTRTIEDEGYVNEAQWMVVRYLELKEALPSAAVTEGSSQGRERALGPRILKGCLLLLNPQAWWS